MQDSTPIIEEMEAIMTEPTIYPSDAALSFLSALIEEFADEWGNKWMMHMRWYSKDSLESASAYSKKIAAEMLSGTSDTPKKLQEQMLSLASGFKERMMGRGFTVGSNDTTAPIIEKSYIDSLMLLDAHFAQHPFLFGRSPSLADFGLAGQLYQCFMDVAAGELMRLHAPYVALWCEAMVNPKDVGDGGFETWEKLAGTLEPFLKTQVSMFLRWSNANAKAIKQGDKELVVDVGASQIWKQVVGGPQRYHAKSLQEIRRKFAGVKSRELNDILQRCECLSLLSGVESKL